MSRSSILRAIIGLAILAAIIIFIISRLGIGKQSGPTEILSERITSTAIIPLDLIDLSTVKRWPEDVNQPYKLIAATTLNNKERPSEYRNIIGVLDVSENADKTFPPGTYLVKLLVQSDPPSTSIILIDQDKKEFEAAPDSIHTDSYEELGLDKTKNYMLYRPGSVRCDYCLSWLNPPLCWCFTCQQ